MAVHDPGQEGTVLTTFPRVVCKRDAFAHSERVVRSSRQAVHSQQHTQITQRDARLYRLRAIAPHARSTLCAAARARRDCAREFRDFAFEHPLRLLGQSSETSS